MPDVYKWLMLLAGGPLWTLLRFLLVVSCLARFPFTFTEVSLDISTESKEKSATNTLEEAPGNKSYRRRIELLSEPRR
jgi:hypothetical protein